METYRVDVTATIQVEEEAENKEQAKKQALRYAHFDFDDAFSQAEIEATVIND